MKEEDQKKRFATRPEILEIKTQEELDKLKKEFFISKSNYYLIKDKGLVL